MRHGIDVSRGYAFILISILLNTGAALLLFNMIGDFCLLDAVCAR